MSSLAWVDFDEAERARARRIMELFSEKESRDELGLGPIRDSISDHLFPGTSTIQTRLRYMLFLPWIYQGIEDLDGNPDQLSREARAREIRLIDALRVGGETGGIIGGMAGSSLQRLPSTIYWAGLRAWGIRLFPGSQEAYFASVPMLGARRRRRRSSEEALAADDSQILTWHAGLPGPPADLLEATRFQLTDEEAGFLIDRLVDSQPECLLTFLANEELDADCDFVWEHPALSDFPSEARTLVADAETFSDVMRGAPLLYNLMLAELRQNDEWIERHRAGLSDWAQELDLGRLSAWSLPDFWTRVRHQNHNILERARQFVHRWIDVASSDPVQVSNSAEARELVRSRERRLKGAQSRFVNRSALDRWGGSSGGGRLSFRWAQASTYVADLANAG